MMIVMRDERTFSGTAIEIVRALHDTAFGVEKLTLSEYVDWVVANALEFEGVVLNCSGNSDEEKATALVSEMLRERLCFECN
jgi:hypothetical protein